MAQEMPASMWRGDARALQSPLDNARNSRTDHALVRSDQPEKHPTARTMRAAILQVGGDGTADIRWQRQSVFSSALASNQHLT
jgi:hypothetical protein